MQHSLIRARRDRRRHVEMHAVFFRHIAPPIVAIADLQKASQDDPFILLLLAQSYEKSGDAARAKEYYQKVMANNGHGPTNAFARPVARKKLAGG